MKLGVYLLEVSKMKKNHSYPSWKAFYLTQIPFVLIHSSHHLLNNRPRYFLMLILLTIYCLVQPLGNILA
jgi:hypothetical protein